MGKSHWRSSSANGVAISEKVTNLAGMFRNIFSLGGFNRAICLATGGAGGYAFTNPDVDNVYDLFPLQKPPPYAFINVYTVNKDERHEFEESWKELARLNQ